MKLLELDPELIRWEDRSATSEERAYLGADDGRIHTFLPQVTTLAEAQGIEFDCPVCTGNRGHRIQVAFRDRGVLDHHGSRSHDGKPSRWQIAGGASISDLTLTPSIDCTHSDPNCWHGFITGGEIT